jgi:short-subunit dehydrogenase
LSRLSALAVRLKDARVIVTGASSGIGRAIALEFARRGARLALAARDEHRLNGVAALIRNGGGNAVVIRTDVTAPGALEHLARETIRQLGGIDILVNNAGVGLHAGIADASSADVDTAFRLNVLAAAEAIRVVVPTMRAQGAGMVINVSSMAGRIVIPRIGYYSATKFALTAIGDALRMEESHRGIRVMNVFPGTTRSAFGENRLGIRGRAAHQRVPPVPAEKVARSVANGVERNQRSVYVSWVPDRLGLGVNHLAGWAVTAVLRRWARRAEP